ncbi:hypothetical protein QJS10_CPB21g00771 [Acorus calamus]|uniref:DNA repair metallo-beta-lactamase domain-containing protein n=1 Tax=Acorus calamus TaxID=4465 RepID=A0AAV9C3I8_ACOCL|nr:hypothetical protein QJS10_CPB21g00771 [Acorus calamus]
MHLLRFDDVFTTKTCLTRVRAVPRYSLTIDTLEALNTVKPTIGIMPSGLPLSVTMFNSNKHSRDTSFAVRLHLDEDQLNSPQRFHRYVYSVPYSEHSCFNEISEFIRLVQQFDMSGIIGSVSRCRDSKMGGNKRRALRNYCSGVRSRVCLIPIVASGCLESCTDKLAPDKMLHSI